MEWNRRVALEKEMGKDSNILRSIRITYDFSSNFLIYPTPLGINVYNWVTDKLIRQIGTNENLRFLGTEFYFYILIIKLLGVTLCRAVPSLSVQLFISFISTNFILGKIARSGNNHSC